MPAVGDTFLVPSGPGELKHLFVVCTGPNGPPDRRVIVSVSSIRRGKHFDPACPVAAGEHKGIVHDSYVAYRFADLKSAADIDRFLASGYYIERGKMSEALLSRVLAGFATSDFTPPWAIKLVDG